MISSARDRSAGRRVVALALGINVALVLAEVAGGILTHSLALLADAGHNAADVGALALAFAALSLAARPATARRTYGFHRAEILAAFINSLGLIVIAAFVFWEAAGRFSDPPEVHGAPLLAIGCGALVVNLASVLMLSRQRRSDLNVGAAFLHMVGDAVASAGVIGAAIFILSTGESLADPIIGVAIGVFILASSFRITWDSTQVLLEATPPGVSTAEVQREMMAVAGVQNIHDLHIWTVTSGFPSLSAHVETDHSEDQHGILVSLRRLLAERFSIDHATIQIETHALHQELESCCGIDTQEVAGNHATYHA